MCSGTGPIVEKIFNYFDQKNWLLVKHDEMNINQGQCIGTR